MKKALLILLLLPNMLFAQINYNVKFRDVVKDIEKNYAGFSDKVENKKGYYDVFKTRLLKDSLTNIKHLKNHVNVFLNFFEDRHLNSYDYFKNENVIADWLNKHRDRKYQFKLLNDNVSYLKIGSFANKKNLDSLMTSCINTILKKKFLIIDIRDNGGGGDFVFEKLLPIISTNDIYSRNINFLATSENWNHFKNTHNVNMGKWNPEYEGKFITAPWIKDSAMFIKSFKYWGTSKFPQYVGVLVNRNVGSAGEQFVFSSKQSLKVKIFGENTGGFFDYSNCRHFEVIADSLYISAPTTKTKGLPVSQTDGNGIAPDFYLKEENQVEQILNYFKNWN